MTWMVSHFMTRKGWEKGKNTVAHKSTPNSKWHFLSLKAHSEFRNFTPISKTSLRIRKLHSEFENSTPNSKTSLRIRRHHSEFENITSNSKRSKSSPFCGWCHGVPSSILSWIPIGIDCLQLAFSLKIYLILISPSAIANHHVTLQ